MKQRFKARELLLLIPFFLIIAAAFYWQRVESASGPNGRGMFVSSFEAEPAPGYSREKGYSHRVAVEVSHPWPRPAWWGETGNIGSRCDPLHPDTPENLIRGTKPKQYMSPGGALTVVEAGQNVRWGERKDSSAINYRFEDGKYRFEHFLKLSEVPTDKGAVTFHGLYRIVGQPQLPIGRVVRKAGQTLPMSGDKSPGAQLMEINASPFIVVTQTGAAGKTTKIDNCWLQFRVRDLASSPSKSEDSRLTIYDVQIEDEKGQIIEPYKTKGFTRSFMAGQQTEDESRPANERTTGVGLSFEQRLQTTGRLTMRGKVSLNQRWPLSFEMVLPPREEAVKSFPETNWYSVPLWRDGKPIKSQ